MFYVESAICTSFATPVLHAVHTDFIDINEKGVNTLLPMKLYDHHVIFGLCYLI